MRRGILSLAAITLSIPVLYGAISGSQSLETAAIRLVVLAAAVGLIDRYVAPLMVGLFRLLGASQVGSSR